MLFRYRFLAIIIFIIVLFGFNCNLINAQFAGGDGTQAIPYQIADCDQLQSIGTSLTSYFVLTTDIDCSATSTWNVNVGSTFFGFDPIDNFAGNFDGQTHIISGLYINRPAETNVGLFGSIISGAVVTNVGLTSVQISGDNSVGGAVGYVYSGGYVYDVSVRGNVDALHHTGGVIGIYEITSASVGQTVTNLSFDGNVRGNDNVTDDWDVGGVIGGIWSTTVNDTTVFSGLSSLGTVSAGTSLSNIGGLVGYSVASTAIINSFSSSIISGETYLGGLVGYSNSLISNSYFTGSVTASRDYSGGLVGYNNDKSVTKSYSTGTVEGNNYVGGLIGYNQLGIIENTYSRGDVTATGDNIGGLIGASNGVATGAVVNSYAMGNVRGVNNLGGFMGYSSRSYINNCFSVGIATTTVSSISNLGGFVGLVEYDTGSSDTSTTFLSNNGWYSYVGALDFAIGNLSDIATSASTAENVTYTESDNSVFYSSSNGVYNVGTTVWDFSTPIWYEWTNDYPVFSAQTTVTPTSTPTNTPTPTPTTTSSSSDSSSSSSGVSVSCNDPAPLTAPDLFQINAGQNSATLYYSPVTSNTTGYAIMYGFSEGDERFGVIAPTINNNQGVQSFTINSLEVGRTYFFKVAAKNGCNSGPWSEWKAIKIVSGNVLASTTSSTATSSAKELPQTGAATPTVILMVTSLLSMGGAWWLFRK